MDYGQKIRMLRSKLVPDYHLSPEEALALTNFKGNSSVLNHKIWANKLNEADNSTIVNLDRALGKLPPTKRKIIYRNVDYDEEKAFRFFRDHIGQTICFSGFLSCTKLLDFNGKSNRSSYSCKLLITLNQPTLCRDMDLIWKKYGVLDPEEQVSFTHLSCFEVLSVAKKKKALLVKLREISFSDDSVLVPDLR